MSFLRNCFSWIKQRKIITPCMCRDSCHIQGNLFYCFFCCYHLTSISEERECNCSCIPGVCYFSERKDSCNFYSPCWCYRSIRENEYCSCVPGVCYYSEQKDSEQKEQAYFYSPIICCFPYSNAKNVPSEHSDKDFVEWLSDNGHFDKEVTECYCTSIGAFYKEEYRKSMTSEQINELYQRYQNHILYAPGGDGYIESKKHYDSIKDGEIPETEEKLED